MDNAQTNPLTHLDREKALFLYSSALERGDFETVSLMLEEARNDAQLEQMILELTEELGREYDRELAAEAVLAEDSARVKQILRECVPSGAFGAVSDETELPPLTVRSVLARMQEDSSLGANIRQEAARLQGTLQQTDVPLPENLSQHSISHLFGEMGLTAGSLVQKMFRRIALLLTMSREQDMSQLAAARRQRQQTAIRRRQQIEEQS
jgi:hypothetical protein